MRLNQYIAKSTGMSRRSADKSIEAGHIKINGKPAKLGDSVGHDDKVTHSGKRLRLEETMVTLLLNKPPGYVCSRDGQGNKTVYQLLPEKFHKLKPVGRLDKDTSGLLLMTEDGQLAYSLTHPKFEKHKIYQIELTKPLFIDHEQAIQAGIKLSDGLSKLSIKGLDSERRRWQIKMHEGRNRQIRRTFEACGYKIRTLHRIEFGDYSLSNVAPGTYRLLLISDNK